VKRTASPRRSLADEHGRSPHFGRQKEGGSIGERKEAKQFPEANGISPSWRLSTERGWIERSRGTPNRNRQGGLKLRSRLDRRKSTATYLRLRHRQWEERKWRDPSILYLGPGECRPLSSNRGGVHDSRRSPEGESLAGRLTIFAGETLTGCPASRSFRTFNLKIRLGGDHPALG